MVKEKVLLEGLHCSNCAMKIEEQIQASQKFKESFVNFANSTLYLENDHPVTEEELTFIQGVLTKVEPGTKAVLSQKEFAAPAVANTKTVKERVLLEGLHCSNCAMKIEEQLTSSKRFKESFVNFANSTLYLETLTPLTEEEKEFIQSVITRVEPGTKAVFSDHNILTAAPAVTKQKILLEGLHCSNCARKIEEKVQKVKGYSNVFVNFASSTLYLEKEGSFTLEDLEKIGEIVTDIEPGTKASLFGDTTVTTAPTSTCGCEHDHSGALKQEHPHEEGACGCGHEHLNHESEAHSHDHAGGACDCGHDQSEHIHESQCADGSCTASFKATTPAAITSKTKAKKEEEKQGLQVKHYAFFVAAVGFIVSFFVGETFVPWVVGASCLLAGYDIMYNGITGIPKLRIDENLLMTVAAIGAFAIGEYREGALVALLFKAGLLLEEKAVNASRRSIAALTDIQAENANVLQGSDFVTIEASGVQIGNKLLIRPGERVPVDCVITKGATTVDSHALTGESVPVNATEGDDLQSGSINLTGAIEATATATFHNSTASRIIELVELSAAKKSNTQNFITRFAKVYTPIVLVMAFAVAFLPPLLGFGELQAWVYKALIFIVSACPCALVIATPLGFFSGVGASSKKGVLIKGSKYLEALSKADTFVFDKTGTITSGELKVSEIYSESKDFTKEQLLQLCASVQQYSNHPIAKAITSSFKGELLKGIEQFQDVVGMGVTAEFEGKELLCGSQKLMEKYHFKLPREVDSNILLALEGNYIGHILVSDQVKESSIKATKELKTLGAKKIAMLTGDSKHAALEAQKACPSIDTLYYSLLPGDKVDKLEEIKKTSETTVFVGDGINDAPVLASSDIGVAMGFGSDAAIEAADAVLMSESLEPLVEAVKISKRTMGIIKFNIYFALLTKVAVVTLGLFGLATTWMAVFADVGVTILSVLNTSRILSNK